MEHGAGGGPKPGLALADPADLAHTRFAVSPWRPQASPGLQHPHALGSGDNEGLRPRGPGYTPRAATLALRASRAPTTSCLRRLRRLRLWARPTDVRHGTSSPLDGRSRESQSEEEERFGGS